MSSKARLAQVEAGLKREAHVDLMESCNATVSIRARVTLAHKSAYYMVKGSVFKTSTPRIVHIERLSIGDLGIDCVNGGSSLHSHTLDIAAVSI